MADELKPCPFCGGDAVLRDGECGIRGMPMTWRNPQCTKCGCDLGYCHHLEAVDRWNRRALSHAAGKEADKRVTQAAGQELAAIHARLLTEADNLLGFAIQRSNMVTHPRTCPPGEVERLRRIASLIGQIFAYGNFKAETYNERELEKLLRENGTFWESYQDFEAASSEVKGDPLAPVAVAYDAMGSRSQGT